MKYNFTGKNRITATLVDGEYIWIAFYGSSGICSLYKSSVYNPSFRYWDVDITANEIKTIIEDDTYLYLSLDSSLYIGAKIQKTNPTNITYFTKHSSLTEKAIDSIKDSTFIYFLLPGISPTNSKIGKYNLSTRNYIETIDLTTVFNAKKIDIDDFGILWILSDLDGTPKIIKVWLDVTWQYLIQILS